MSVFEDGQPQNVMVAPEDATSTIHNGFWAAMKQSYNSQLQLNSMYSVESAMREQEDKQITLARQHGVTLQPLSSSTADNAKQGAAWWNTNPYWQMIHPTAGQTAAPFADVNDKALSDLKAKYPDAGFQNYADMYGTVKANAQTLNAQDAATTNSWPGTFGSFAGGAAAGFNPFARQNSPLGTAAMLIPGLGQGGIAARLAGNTILGGVQQAAMGALGVNDERQALGLGTTSMARNFAEGAVGGLAFGALHEAGGAAVRWLGGRLPFESPVREPFTPEGEPVAASPEGPQNATPPAPEAPQDAGAQVAGEAPPAATVAANTEPAVNQAAYDAQPYGPSRDAIPRVDEDMDAYTAQLDDPFGPDPADMDRWSSSPAAQTPEARAALVRNGADVDAIARQIDPQPVTEFQNLATDMEGIRQQIETLRTDENAGATTQHITEQRQALSELTAQQDQLRSQMQGASRRNAQRLQERLDDLETQRPALEEQAQRQTHAEQITDLRSRLVDMDERRRDLAPIVNRAYETARQTVSRRAPAAMPSRSIERRAGAALRQRTEEQTDQAMRVTQEAANPPETTAQPPEEGSGPDSTGTTPEPRPDALTEAGANVEGDTIRLPSGATVSMDDLAEATMGEGGDMETRQTVRDMVKDMAEQHALDAASRVCAI